MTNKDFKIISGGGQLNDPKRVITAQLCVNLKNRTEDMFNLIVYVKKDLDVIEKEEVKTCDSATFNLASGTYKIFVLFDRNKLIWATDEIKVSVPDQSEITIDLDTATIDDSTVDPY